MGKESESELDLGLEKKWGRATGKARDREVVVPGRPPGETPERQPRRLEFQIAEPGQFA
jgi:hypothetical protein